MTEKLTVDPLPFLEGVPVVNGHYQTEFQGTREASQRGINEVNHILEGSIALTYHLLLLCTKLFIAHYCCLPLEDREKICMFRSIFKRFKNRKNIFLISEGYRTCS